MVTGYSDLNVFEYFFQFIKNSIAIILPSSACELGIIGAEAVSNYIVLDLFWRHSQYFNPINLYIFINRLIIYFQSAFLNPALNAIFFGTIQPLLNHKPNHHSMPLPVSCLSESFSISVILSVFQPSSFHPTSLLMIDVPILNCHRCVTLPHVQKVFVPFRYQGEPIARVPKQAVLPAVSRVHFTRSNANVFYERWRPLFGSDIPERFTPFPFIIRGFVGLTRGWFYLHSI